MAARGPERPRLPVVVRSGAAAGLGASGKVSFVKRLTELANDAGEVQNVRANAIDAVVHLQGRETIPFLKSLVKPEIGNSGVRCSAAMLLVKLTGGAVEDVHAVEALAGRCLIDDGSGEIMGWRKKKARDAL